MICRKEEIEIKTSKEIETITRTSARRFKERTMICHINWSYGKLYGREKKSMGKSTDDRNKNKRKKTTNEKKKKKTKRMNPGK